jgi:hypothetical protein
VILLATLVLAPLGLVRTRVGPFWRYVFYGMAMSVVPASLTVDIFHMLRLAAFPIFLVVLTIPALAWLGDRWRSSSSARIALSVMVALTLGQGALFQLQYHVLGPERGHRFHADYPDVFAAALETGVHPIYLVDGDTPGYIHAYWYGTLAGVDLSRFVHLPDSSQLPSGEYVISTEESCIRCDVLLRREQFTLYRVR